MLVWVPREDVGRLEGLPGTVRVAAIPAEAAGDPHADTVEMLVPPFATRAELRALLGALPALRVVQSLGAGVDSYADLVPPGVVLCDARGVHDIPVAEWVLAAVLADAKRLPEHRDRQRDGAWEPLRARELHGMSVLVVGHGSIGRAVAERLEPFGAQVTGVARGARDGVAGVDDLPALLPHADIVVLLAPLTGETRHLADARFLAHMRDGALLVNAARGPIFDTAALLDALQAGRLRAALDVTDPEPLPPDHPLWREPGALITPHVAGSSDRFRERAYALVREQVERLVRGEPLTNVVGPEGY
jgi:phosphoglycerate dehydrogenase-like enzyme